MSSEVAVEAQQITKRLRGHQVLDGVNLSVDYGTSVGILGENGVGKSIFLRILAGLVLADGGQVTIGGTLVGRGSGGRLAPDTGIMIDTPGFLPRISGFETLQVLARIQGRIHDAEIRHALEAVGLDPSDRRPVQAYSLGMRQRLGIAQAVMERPRVLLLDEPTNGLDRQSQDRVPAWIESWCHDGMAVIWTSHDQTLLEALEPDQLWRLDQGHLTPVACSSRSLHTFVEWPSGDMLAAAVAWLPPMQVFHAGERLITTLNDTIAPDRVEAVLRAHDISPVRVWTDDQT